MNRDLLRALESLDGGGRFCCRHTAPAQDLYLEITGVGLLRLPLSARSARSRRMSNSPISSTAR